ncbi:hypothetical protein Barb4_00607 [Bacteroidales bacterium Barb4]|nr:hypothetical protein Barb4_00607 [Bacteroidales bacterium Barb4]
MVLNNCYGETREVEAKLMPPWSAHGLSKTLLPPCACRQKESSKLMKELLITRSETTLHVTNASGF